MQLVLSVKNANFLRALLLDGLTVSVYEAATGLKLGTAAQGSLVIGARANTLCATPCTTPCTAHHASTYPGCSPMRLGCH